MNRKDFFKSLVGSLVGVVLTPYYLKLDTQKEYINTKKECEKKINYNPSWESIYKVNFSPKIWEKWYNKYGKGFMANEFLDTYILEITL